MNPRPRTKTKRRALMQDAKRHLARYGHLLAYEGTPDDRGAEARVKSLLWAQSAIERALDLETQGRLGDAMATPGRIVRRQEARA